MLSDRPIKFVPGDLPRKWLFDDSIELVVWFSDADHIFGFQIHYDIQDIPKAFTFTEPSGFSHHLIDSGEDIPKANSTPILSEPIPVNISEVEQLFRTHSENLPDSIRSYILGRLLEYTKRVEQGAAANP
jgi:hypothetical protein